MLGTRLRPRSWSLIALLAACSGTGPTPPDHAGDAGTAPATDRAANPETPTIDVPTMDKDVDHSALVPSPVETQKALEASGIETKLASLVPKHMFAMDKGDTDRAAVRTGIVLADLLLTTKTATKEELVDRLGLISKGMEQLQAGADIQATLKDLTNRIQTDAVSRDELLKEFDELSGVLIPELEFNGQERVVPLIEAGSWLEGANLVATALKSAETKDAAEKLLRAPTVVDYFLRYVRTEGAEKAPEAVTQKLEESLLALKAIAEKPAPLTDADLDTVIKVTNDVTVLL
jgi:hypothetical protein